MKKIFFGVFISALLIACNNEKTEDKPATNEPSSSNAKKPPTEILDISEADGIKAGFAALAKKDVAGLTANYDDSIRYYWSGGDSAIGKQKVVDYWKSRIDIIDSISFSETILLPIRINESQSPKYALVGKWVLSWNLSHVKYSNGKWLHFWVHTDYHYNDAGKINSVVQYIDRHPIMEATKDIKK